MADNRTGLNAQYESPPFGLGGNYTNSGAPGTATSPGGTAGPVIGSPVVSNPYGSVQVPANVPQVSVTSGDTCAFSDDNPVHDSPLLPGDPGQYMATGAGTGHVAGPHHPNAGVGA